MSGGSPVFVITGTSRGLGRGVAEFFLASGARVAGCSRGPCSIEHPSYQHWAVDVTKDVDVTSWIREVKSKFGRIDALVCNVGAMPAGALVPLTSRDTWDECVRSNLDAAFFVCRDVSKVMIRQRFGRIVAISSIMAVFHGEGTVAYAASKAGVIAMIKVLAKELAAVGITCNVVAPGLVTTGASTDLGEAVHARVLAHQVIKRPIEVVEVCRVIEFFTLPQTASVTGQVLLMGSVE